MDFEKEAREKTVPQSHAFAALDVLRITKDQLEAAENEIRHLHQIMQRLEDAYNNERHPVGTIVTLLRQEIERKNKYRYLLQRKPSATPDHEKVG